MTAASTGTPGRWRSVSWTQAARVPGTALGRPVPLPCGKPWHPLETLVGSRPTVGAPGTGRADWCAAAGLPFGLGPALARQAIPGGQAPHDTLDAQHIAGLRRGGLPPQASVSPAAVRATRALLRRRKPLAPNRGELRAHVPHPNRPANLPALGNTIADQATRDGIADRLAEPAAPQRSAVDRSRIDDDAPRLRD